MNSLFVLAFLVRSTFRPSTADSLLCSSGSTIPISTSPHPSLIFHEPWMLGSPKPFVSELAGSVCVPSTQALGRAHFGPRINSSFDNQTLSPKSNHFLPAFARLPIVSVGEGYLRIRRNLIAARTRSGLVISEVFSLLEDWDLW